jgi:hypothetical protein
MKSLILFLNSSKTILKRKAITFYAYNNKIIKFIFKTNNFKSNPSQKTLKLESIPPRRY